MLQQVSKQIRMVIQHEAGHLKANDSLKETIVSTAMTLLTYGLSTQMLKKLTAFPKLQAAAIAASAIPLYAINRLINNAYSRHNELRADEQIPNDSDYLAGGISFFEQKGKAQCKNRDDSPLSYYWHATHPTNEYRLNRFKERLEKLKAQ